MHACSCTPCSDAFARAYRAAIQRGSTGASAGAGTLRMACACWCCCMACPSSRIRMQPVGERTRMNHPARERASKNRGLATKAPSKINQNRKTSHHSGSFSARIFEGSNAAVKEGQFFVTNGAETQEAACVQHAEGRQAQVGGMPLSGCYPRA